MIRTLRPTDIVAYLGFRSKAGHNEALLRPGDSPSKSSLRGFLSRSLSLDPRRESWLQIQDGRIDGLVGARSRLGTDIWDIDQLISATHQRGGQVYANLLRHLITAAGEEGVQKVFLRAMLQSPAVESARLTGFYQYAVERVYRLPCLRPYPHSPVFPLRPRRRADHHALFHLYCSVVPVVVRQVEGMTLQEWRWTEGWGLRPPVNWRVDLPRTRRDFVLDRESGLGAWLQIRAGARSIMTLMRVEEEPDAREMIRFALNQLRQGKTVYFPVREYQSFLEPILREEGFELIAEQALLARALAIRVYEPKLLPIRAHMSR